MAVTKNITLAPGTAVEVIRGSEAKGMSVLVKNIGANPAYIGPDNTVTSASANGARLDTTDGYVQIKLDKDEPLFAAVAAAQAATLHIIAA